ARRRGVVLRRRGHGLVTAGVAGEGVLRRGDGVGVEQFGADLGDRPVPREAAVADPAEDVPADGPPGQREGRLDLGALGGGVPGAARAGAAVELADQLHWAAEGEEAAVAVVADVHHAAAGRALPGGDGEVPQREVSVLGPAGRADGDLRVGALQRGAVPLEARQGKAGTPPILASSAVVEKKWPAAGTPDAGTAGTGPEVRPDGQVPGQAPEGGLAAGRRGV